MSSRPIASVHVDIAELMARVADITPGPEQTLDQARAEWLMTWAKALSYREPSLHPYAAKLLQEAAEYQAEASEKKRQAANARWEKERAMHTDAPHARALHRKAPHNGAMQTMLQSRAEQTEQSIKNTRSRPGKGNGSQGGKRTRGAA